MPGVRNLLNQRFTRLVVLARAGSDHKGKALWRCRCDCGQEVVALGTYLLAGATKSCGCLHRELAIQKGKAKLIDLTGQRFGRLVVVQRAERGTSKGDARWHCRCDCGGESRPTGGQLRRGSSLSCGCLRDELALARAAVMGTTQRVKVCRTCGKIYTAIGPQKDCSDECRLRVHAETEARRREYLAGIRTAQEIATLTNKLNQRLDDGQTQP